MFVLVRHGNTFEAGTKPRRIGARTDLPLTEKGIEQALSLARLFAGQGMQFDRVLVSPLTRTRQTAQHILALQVSPPALEPCDFLREIDHGPDENKTEDEVRERIGQAALEAWDRRAEAPTGWIVETEERLAAWRDLFAQKVTSDHTTLLVTSNGAARFALMSDPTLARAADGLESLKLPTGGYGVIGRAEDGGLRLEAWGKRP